MSSPMPMKTGTRNRTSTVAVAIPGEKAFGEQGAPQLGLEPGDTMRLETRRGAVELKVRSDRDVPDGLKRKIALMCDVDAEGVCACVDAPSIYDIPRVLHREELDAYVVRRLNLPFRDVDWTQWNDLLQRVHEPRERKLKLRAYADNFAFNRRTPWTH